jgi:hypothetical protein
MGKHTKMEVVRQEQNHKKNYEIWELPPHISERRFGYKLGKEGVLEAEKGITDDYPFKSCIVCKSAGLCSSGRTNLFYLRRYSRKVERESKAEQKRGRERQFNSTGPTFG